MVYVENFWVIDSGSFSVKWGFGSPCDRARRAGFGTQAKACDYKDHTFFDLGFTDLAGGRHVAVALVWDVPRQGGGERT
jgi:hypothetical protein